jgi:[histone H3]-lysine36 N-dimethyltransferase SETMAR
MTRVRDFVADLAKTKQTVKKIKELVDEAFGDMALKKTQIYDIVKKVRAGKNASDQRHLNGKKTKRTESLVAAVAAAVEKDRRVTLQELSSVHNTSYGTIRRILKEELGLTKKSARWVPKLLSEEQKQQRVDRCQDFVNMVQRRSKAVLDNIVTMDESAVSFHTPETKQQSKQWVKKGQPGPLKARVHATRSKQMVLVFFDSRGVIYTDYVAKGSTVNSQYIISALGRFLKTFKQKRPVTASQDWFLHWDNAPAHTAAVVQEFLAAKSIRTIAHPPYSPDLAPADFFLFPRVKSELAGDSLDQGSFRSSWTRALKTIYKDDYATAFRRWLERCEKCI